MEEWKTKSDEVVRKIRSRPEENGGERNRATTVSSQSGNHDGGSGSVTLH